MDFISSTLLWLSHRPIHLRFIWQQHSHTRPCLCPPLAIANWLWDLWVYCVHVLCPRLFVASAPLPVNHFHKSIPFWMSHPQITIQRGPPAAVVTVPLKVFPKRIRRRRNNNKFQFMSQNVLHVPLTSTPPLHVIVIIFYTTMITNHHPRGGRESRGWHSRHPPSSMAPEKQPRRPLTITSELCCSKGALLFFFLSTSTKFSQHKGNLIKIHPKHTHNTAAPENQSTRSRSSIWREKHIKSASSVATSSSSSFEANGHPFGLRPPSSR